MCWRIWRDIRRPHKHHGAPNIAAAASLKRAILQIVVADISMSLDNVLAVAGAARRPSGCAGDRPFLSVALMGTAANLHRQAFGALSLDQLYRPGDRFIRRRQYDLAWLGRSAKPRLPSSGSCHASNRGLGLRKQAR